MLTIVKRFYFEELTLLALALVALVPWLAFAQVDAATVDPASLPTMLVSVLAVALPLLMAVIRAFMKDKTDARMRAVGIGIEIAYHATTNLAKYTKTTVDDKVATALGYLRSYLASEGYASTTDVEQRARLTWDAMHAQEKLALQAPATSRPSTPPSAP